MTHVFDTSSLIAVLLDDVQKILRFETSLETWFRVVPREYCIQIDRTPFMTNITDLNLDRLPRTDPQFHPARLGSEQLE
jgi:hypothetical protein